MLNLRRHAYSLLERPGGGPWSQTGEGRRPPGTNGHGSAPIASVAVVARMLNLRRHAYSLLERPGGGPCSQTVEGQGRPETSAHGCARSVSVNKAHRPAQLQNMRLK